MKLRGEGAFHALVSMDEANYIHLCKYSGGSSYTNYRAPNQQGRESCLESAETELELSVKVDRNPVIGTLVWCINSVTLSLMHPPFRKAKLLLVVYIGC